MHGNDQNRLKLKTQILLEIVRQTQVEHGMCVSLSKDAFNVKVCLSWSCLEIVNTHGVGIFHLCESSSFYFQKLKVEYEGFTTFLNLFFSSNIIKSDICKCMQNVTMNEQIQH